MIPLSGKQLGYIMGIILVGRLKPVIKEHPIAKKPYNASREEAEARLRKHVDYGTASDVIKAWKDGHENIALNQLKHLQIY